MTPTESASVDDRIRMLRWRTIAVGWGASLLVIVGLVTTLLACGELGSLMFGRGGDGVVAFHLPATLRHADGLPFLSLLFAGLAIVGAWGLSTGHLRRSHSHAALALCLLAGIADFLLAAPLHQPLFALPSRVERLVDRGAYAEADRLLAEPGDGSMQARQAYARAQIALRAGDSQGLGHHGRPLLQSADAFVYTARTDPALYHIYFQSINDLRIDVLAAIDRQLNGAASSAAGIAFAAARSTRGSPWTHAIGLSASALALAASGLLLAALWRRMRANVLRIIDLAE